MNIKGKPIVPSVCFSATYEFECTDDLVDVVLNRSGYIYSRWDNPTVCAAEQALAEMEGYDDAVAFGSGMAAITTAIMAFLDGNSRVVTMRETYGGTFAFIQKFLPNMGVETVDLSCHEIDRFYDEIEKVKMLGKALILGGAFFRKRISLLGYFAAEQAQNSAEARFPGKITTIK